MTHHIAVVLILGIATAGTLFGLLCLAMDDRL